MGLMVNLEKITIDMDQLYPFFPVLIIKYFPKKKKKKVEI